MSWLYRTFTRSIGKKQLVALTGLGLCSFLLVHLAGNLLIYAGPDAFNGYAKKLEDSVILVPAEVGLAVMFLAHMVLALWVTVENWRARPVPYHGKKRWEGGKTIGSATMWITGPTIFVFLIVHLLNFRLADRGDGTLYDLVVATFDSLPYTFGYVAAMLVVALHVSHGFQSGFRTFGLVHPKYIGAIMWLGWAFAVAVAVGYSSIPAWIHIFLGAKP